MSAGEEKLRDYLKRVTGDLRKTRQQLLDLQRVHSEPIAIVGIACRFPGGVRTMDDLWTLVDDEVDAVADSPTDRGWDVDAAGGPADGWTRVSAKQRGGFLDHATEFDAEFFGIPPQEALAMDPQQRVMLELSWEAVEQAGIDPTTLKGTEAGVFTGVIPQEYANLVEAAAAEESVYTSVGSATSVLSGRVAYTLGLRGPAISIDTACSSSLVALHLAASSLRAGECRMALAGGVTIMASPNRVAEFSNQGAISSDGRCRAFAESADGTGWSEGAGVLVVERLSDAQRLGHKVHAIIRSSAINQDGASNGLTAPYDVAQEEVILRALREAGLAPEDIDLIEAHGTGTRLGDSIEAQALAATYGRERSPANPVYLGTFKSNIGHAQAAAGLGGIIKVVQAIRHRRMPKTLHIDKPTSDVDWSSGRVSLLTRARDWPAGGRTRRAAVSGFGISGTNAHVIVEEADTAAEPAPVGTKSPGVIAWPVSGHTDAAVRAQADHLLSALDDHIDPSDVGYSLSTARAALEQRAVVVGGDLDTLRRGVTALAAGADAPGLVRGRVSQPSVAFVFTGGESRRAGMGERLYRRYRVFAQTLDEVCDAFGPHLDRDLRAVMFGDDTRALHSDDYAQAALFGFGIASHRLAESWGLRPKCVGGHEIGELSAAHVAGVFSMSDACALVAARGRVTRARSREDADGSPPARNPRDAFMAVANGIEYHVPALPLASNATGELAGEEIASADYWVQRLSAPARFADSLACLHADGATMFVEIGPDEVGCGIGAAALSGAEFVPLTSADGPEDLTLVSGMAQAWTRGVPVDLERAFDGTAASRVDLPSYAFQRERYWPGRTESTARPHAEVNDPIARLLTELDEAMAAQADDVDGRARTVNRLEELLAKWNSHDRTQESAGASQSWEQPLNRRYR